jgi:hypothetical protein
MIEMIFQDHMDLTAYSLLNSHDHGPGCGNQMWRDGLRPRSRPWAG